MATRHETINGKRIAVHYPNTAAETAASWARVHRACEAMLTDRESAAGPGLAGITKRARMTDMRMNRIERSLASDIKSGAAADACRFRFKALAANEIDRDRHGFACVVAGWAAAELGAKSVPPVCWFKAAGPGRADWGSDSWNGNGFMDGNTGQIWLSKDLPSPRIVYVVAHETFHAVKHRDRAQSVEVEHEADGFAFRASDQWDLSPDPYAKLFVVLSKADLPRHGGAGSSALVQEEMKLYRVSERSIPSHVKWVEHRRLTKDGIMRTDAVYLGRMFLGTTETIA